MRFLLVLYPIQVFVDSYVPKELPLETRRRYAEIYQRLLRGRYPDFRVVWIMFSCPLGKPDMSQLWDGILIKESDIVGACGVTFDKFCKEEIYPDPQVILNFCPEPEELIIGGFHFGDCVERVAKYAHEKEINVLVDDNLTEHFFKITRKSGWNPSETISLSRKKIGEKIREFHADSPYELEKHREWRKSRPWLVKI